MTGFDLLAHNCKHNHKQDTYALVFSCNAYELQVTRGTLYCLSNSPANKLKKWPHTGKWTIALFQAKGSITDAHIANMI
eukprot:5719222-Ditylum_brightwellii.AAC.1